MYAKSEIKKLSEKQLSKLLNGHAVRVQYGSGLNVQLSPEQHKKLMKANAKQKGMTIRFDPYQLLNHGHLRKSGIGRMAKKLMGGNVISTSKDASKALITAGSDRAVRAIEGSGLRGGNVIATSKDAAKSLITAGSDRAVRSIEGSGVSRRKKFSKWTKELGSAAKSIGKFIKPVAKPIFQAMTKRAVNEINTYGDPVAEADAAFDTFTDNFKSEPKTQIQTQTPIQYSYFPEPIYASPYNPRSFNQYDYQDEVIATPVSPDYKNETLYYGGKLRRKPRSKKGGALYVAGARSGGGSLFPA
jgi:hypothetical protein